MNRWVVSLAGAFFVSIMLFALDGRSWAEESEPARAEATLMDVMETPSRSKLQSPEEVSKRPEGFSRAWLESHGMHLETRYTAEGFTSVYNGAEANHSPDYLGSVNTSLTLDLSKMNIGRGQVFFSAQHLHGRGINGLGLGAVQTPSSFDNPTFTRFIEAFYTDTYSNNRLTIKVGRQYADSEFDVAENGADFVNSSYGHIPTVPLPTYPYPDLGASAWISPTQHISAGVGVYRGQYASAQDPIDQVANPSRKGVFTLAEVQLKPFAADAARYGVVRVGAWQQGQGAWLTSDTTISSSPMRNYGVYATADYSLRKPSQENPAPGFFLQWGWAPADRNAISGYWGTGISYPGFVFARQQDSAGLGVTQATLSNGERETVLELFYKWRANARIFVQPDMQWVHNVSGDSRNAVLAAVRVGFTL